MPDRIIRDELLTSPRYCRVSSDAKLLYMHLLLVADDTARFSGDNFTLRASCFPGQSMVPTKMERLLSEISQSGLIHVYEVAANRFVFIPRFRQRLRFQKSKFPAPPQEINDLDDEKTDLSQTQDRLKTDSRPTRVRLKTAEVKRREEKGSTSKPGVEVKGCLLIPSSVGSEPENHGLEAVAPLPVIAIPLNDNTEYPVSQALADEWAVLYPAVDIPQTLREIRGWNLAHRRERKTLRGVMAHITYWLQGEQNKHG